MITEEEAARAKYTLLDRQTLIQLLAAAEHQIQLLEHIAELRQRQIDMQAAAWRREFWKAAPATLARVA